MRIENIEQFKLLVLELETNNPDCALNPRWVLWMLDELKTDHVINPKWFKASHVMLFSGQAAAPDALIEINPKNHDH